MKTDEQKNNDYKKNFPKWRKTFLELKEKDYKKALEWWKENLDIQADTYYNDEFTDRLPFIPSNEFHTSKKVLTRLPVTPWEKEMFCLWWKDEYSKLYPKYDLERQIQRAEKAMNSNNPKGYLQKELDETEEYIQYRFITGYIGKGTNKRKLSDSLVERPRQIFLNYDTEGIEPDWETSERATVEDFILAKYYSDYHKFLIDKLEELKSGKKIPMADLIDEFDEPGKWVTRQRYLLMDELGFFKTEKYKTLSQKKKHKIVSIILKCAVRDAEDLVNNKRKYQRTPKDKARVGSFLS